MGEVRLIQAAFNWASASSLLKSTGITPNELAELLEQGQIVGGRLASGFLLVDLTSLSAAVEVLDGKAAANLVTTTVPEGADLEVVLTLEQAAALGGVSPRTMRSAIRAGDLPAGRKGTGARSAHRVSRQAVLDWIGKKNPSEATVYRSLAGHLFRESTTGKKRSNFSSRRGYSK